MSHTQKLMIAIAGVFVIGFVMVGSNKEQTTQQKEASSMIRALTGMQNMAHNKCPKLIKKHTGSTVDSLVSNSETDRATYLTLEWKGDPDDNFKDASCTLTVQQGGITKLIIDGKTLINKE